VDPAVSRGPLAEDERVRIQTGSCEMCGRQKGTVRFVSDHVSSSSLCIITPMFRPAFIRRKSRRSLGNFKQRNAVLNKVDHWADTALNPVSKKPSVHVNSTVIPRLTSDPANEFFG